MYFISGIEIPNAGLTRLGVDDTGVYIKVSHMDIATAQNIAESLGYWYLATPTEQNKNPSLKNENIFWTNKSSPGKNLGHLSILIYKFD